VSSSPIPQDRISSRFGSISRLTILTRPIGNYLILYEALPDGITVVRVVHGARQLSLLLD
jgi:plasmid stabilization system protein ParE